MKKVVISCLTIVFLLLILCGVASAELLAPQNVQWKEGSTATAIWEPVDGADYYAVSVYVWNGNEELGVEETGTSSPEIDVQQEINKIAKAFSCKSVQCEVSIQAASYDNATQSFSYGPVSSRSPKLQYTLDFMNQLSTPVINEFSSQYTANWLGDPNADMYNVQFRFNNNGVFSYYTEYGVTFSGRGTSNISANLSSSIKDGYVRNSLSRTSVNVSFRVYSQIWVNSPKNYTNSDYSDWSNEVEYYNDDPIPLSTPQALEWIDDTNSANWLGDPNADMYNVQFRYNNNGTYSYYTEYGVSFSGRGTSNISADLTSSIKDGCVRNNLSGIQVEVSFRVYSQIWVNSPKNFSNSDYSDWSTEVEYYNPIPEKLTTPTNLSWTSAGYNVSWIGDPNSDMYNVQFRYLCDGAISYYTEYGVSFSGRNTENITAALSLSIKDGYNRQSFSNLNVSVSFRVYSQIWVNSPKNYSASDYSEWSDWLYYNPYGLSTPEDIILSPSTPIQYKGNSMYLGKTIVPENAYYSSISWSTSDTNIVSVNDSGLITGQNIGAAEITATIGEATNTVTATVYTIETNIENEDDGQTVTDTAGAIIDDIGNNENPDISNTDIEAEDVDDLHDQILEGVERGDEFRTDIVLSKRDWAHFKKYEKQIQQWLNNGVFAGGFDINVEVYHQDGQGNKYHIANITQFENEIGFTIDAEALEESAPGQLKDMRMIRIHDGQLEVIPVTVNSDGSISAKSDKFSDFLLMYVNEDDPGKPQINITVDKTINVAPEDTVTVTYEIIGSDYTVESARWVNVNHGSSSVTIESATGTLSLVPRWGGECYLEITLSYGDGKVIVGRSETIYADDISVNIQMSKTSARHGDALNATYQVVGGNSNYSVETYWEVSILTNTGRFSEAQVERKANAGLSGNDTINIGNNISSVEYVVWVTNERTGCGSMYSAYCYVTDEATAINTDASISIQVDKTGTIKPADKITATYAITGQDVQIHQARWVEGGWSDVKLTSLSGTSTHYAGYSGECFFEITISDDNGNYICAQSEHLLVKDIEVSLSIDNAHVFAGDTVSARYLITGDASDYKIETYWMLDIWPNGYGTEVGKKDSGTEGVSTFLADDNIRYISFCVSVSNTKTGMGHWYEDTRTVCSRDSLIIQGGFAPTETQSGQTNVEYCSSCGKTFCESVEIPALNQGQVLRLPNGIEVIEEEAFEAINAVSIIIPNSCKEIKDNAFANCKNLLFVSMPTSIIVADSAFNGCGNLLIENNQ